MERRADRELPSVEAVTFRWGRTLPIFAFLIAVSSVAIFNYQKMSSPVVSSTLYALRTSPKARAYLGDEIYFYRQIPWISGTMNQIRGRIDISFRVRGTRADGIMRFSSFRPTSRGIFETTEWSLTTTSGDVIDLLDGDDPFRAMPGLGMDEEELEQAGRGFRTELK
ncbi:cytochrome oxidase complex assembly protein 1-domain-containing protein [Xylariales sp. PMI_506]|nr:cytochrome oxidase complex assembly protein 1-domain-containing protein [Xylariales sp. PMI_506]